MSYDTDVGKWTQKHTVWFTCTSVNV